MQLGKKNCKSSQKNPSLSLFLINEIKVLTLTIAKKVVIMYPIHEGEFQLKFKN